MTQDKDVQVVGTTADYLIQRLADQRNGEEFAIEYLKSSFLASAVQELFYARHNAHLTQEQVAQKLGKKQAAIARWEADFDGKMSLRQYVELALACDVIPFSIKFEAVGSIRDYVINNPGVQWTQDLYESWQKKGVWSQVVAHHSELVRERVFTLRPEVPSAASANVLVSNQEVVLTAKSVEYSLQEQHEGSLIQLETTLKQQVTTNTNLTLVSGNSQGSTFLQPAA